MHKLLAVLPEEELRALCMEPRPPPAPLPAPYGGARSLIEVARGVLAQGELAAAEQLAEVALWQSADDAALQQEARDVIARVHELQAEAAARARSEWQQQRQQLLLLMQ